MEWREEVGWEGGGEGGSRGGRKGRGASPTAPTGIFKAALLRVLKWDRSPRCGPPTGSYVVSFVSTASVAGGRAGGLYAGSPRRRKRPHHPPPPPRKKGRGRGK